VELPVGLYSVLAVEDALFYVNSFDGEGKISPVEVADGQVTEIRFGINYLSTW
jgi:hypothetical protein